MGLTILAMHCSALLDLAARQAPLRIEYPEVSQDLARRPEVRVLHSCRLLVLLLPPGSPKHVVLRSVGWKSR